MKKNAIIYSTRSDKGCKRRNNEDNLFCGGTHLTADTRNSSYKNSGTAEVPAVFAVFDGIGGEESGETASLIAAEVLEELSPKILKSDRKEWKSIIDDFVTRANKRIKEHSENSLRMGTTMAIVVIGEDAAEIFNIGDSRVYMLHKRSFRQVTIDDTVAAGKITKGLCMESEARRSKDWNKLTACIGIPSSDDSFFKARKNSDIPIKDKLNLLLCSDGLTDMLSDEQIKKILRKSKSPDRAVRMLLSEALNKGGKDNITVIVIKIRKKFKVNKRREP